jgi:hypothetical protein
MISGVSDISWYIVQYLVRGGKEGGGSDDGARDKIMIRPCFGFYWGRRGERGGWWHHPGKMKTNVV